MTIQTEIEEIEKRFDEKFLSPHVKNGWNRDAYENGAPAVKAFFRAEQANLLSKFTAAVNGNDWNHLGHDPLEGIEDDFRTCEDAWNTHHRSVAEKAEEIIKQLKS